MWFACSWPNFPTYLQDRWKFKVYTIRHTERREGQLFELIDLVYKENVLVNDLLFLRDAVSQYLSKPEKYDQSDRRRRLKTYMTETREGSESV